MPISVPEALVTFLKNNFKKIFKNKMSKKGAIFDPHFTKYSPCDAFFPKVTKMEKFLKKEEKIYP